MDDAKYWAILGGGGMKRHETVAEVLLPAGIQHETNSFKDRIYLKVYSCMRMAQSKSKAKFRCGYVARLEN